MATIARRATARTPRAASDVGAPNLTTAIWQYGSDMKDLTYTRFTYARNSTMPAWGKQLDPETIKSLALYVHSLGGGT